MLLRQCFRWIIHAIREDCEKNRLDRYSMSVAGFPDVSFRDALMWEGGRPFAEKSVQRKWLWWICGRKGKRCDEILLWWTNYIIVQAIYLQICKNKLFMNVYVEISWLQRHTQQLTRGKFPARDSREFMRNFWNDASIKHEHQAFFLASSIFCFSEVFCGKLETFWPFYRSGDTESTTWDNIIKHLSDSRRSIMSVHSLLHVKCRRRLFFHQYPST